ncbi:CPBP family intramembrane glutamic endopeptidase [Ekhidna sp.]|uniref:CPBP family intramembrane glutamic endopeptidase n=1 Tax=Ekhidna sp. TaxID=2608089 RepID=UPI003C7E23C8
MKSKIKDNRSLEIHVLIEIVVVLTAMIGVKWIFDNFNIIGAGSLGIWCGIFAATYFMKKRKVNWKTLGLTFPKGKREWLTGLGLALLTVVIVFLMMGLVLDPLLSQFGLEKPSDVADRFRFFLGKPWVFTTYLITVVWIGAALGEELLMRGYLLNRLSNFFGSSKSALTISLVIHSIIFGMLHSYQGLAGIITTAFIAMVFGTVYLISKKRLFPVIMAHLLINTITLTAFYLTGGEVN